MVNGESGGAVRAAAGGRGRKPSRRPRTSEICNAGRQIGEMQQRTRIERHHPFKAVHQFTNVARPVIFHHRLHGVMRKHETAPFAAKKAFNQERNIFFAFAQRRQRQANHVEPVKQIFPKPPRRDFFLQIPVGRGHNPNVDLDPLQGAERPQFLLLQHAEQLDLHFERQFADFIEESRAAVGQFDQPAFGVDAPVNAPRTWPNSSLSIIVPTSDPQSIGTNCPRGAAL